MIIKRIPATESAWLYLHIISDGRLAETNDLHIDGFISNTCRIIVQYVREDE